MAVGLRYAAEAAIDGMEETSLRALTTIEQLLPHRLRRRVSALASSVTSLRGAADDDVVDPEALSVLAAACRDREDVRFDYQRHDGEGSRRHVQPHKLVTAGRRWYLVAWDHRRRDWRTFRLDRIRRPLPVGSHFSPREIPGGDASTSVAGALGSTPRDRAATIAIGAPLANLADVLRWVDHTPIEMNTDSCSVQVRSEDLGRLVMTVARIALTAPVTVIEPAELADTVLQLATHLTASPPDPPAARQGTSATGTATSGAPSSGSRR